MEHQTNHNNQNEQDYGDNPLEVRESDTYQDEYVRSFVDKWDDLIDWEGRSKSEGEFFIEKLREHGAKKVLDVATGTGRLPRAILRQPPFDGRIIALDLSQGMLDEAVRRTAQFSDRLTFIHQGASQLPFKDNRFDAVTCIEALEFMPHPMHVLDELIRVLRPGGVLLVTNRIGPDARFLPGRAFDPDEFEEILQQRVLEQVKTRTWQVDYSLVWAVKDGTPRGGGIRPLPDILSCPHCTGSLVREADSFRCEACGRRYPVKEGGIIEMAEVN